MTEIPFYKYHGLGNDYIVIDPADHAEPLTDFQIETICHRNYGIGSDGILYGPLPSDRGDFRMRILNPDASEAEKSGNGLRIFSRYLWDKQHVTDKPFSIDTLGGLVQAQIMNDQGTLVQVEMGRITFQSAQIPVNGDPREVVKESLTVQDRTFIFTAAGIGNPHCVIPMNSISRELAEQYGPDIETHALFPNKINVQFMQVLDRNNIRIEIWERGAGYTLASGSSSSAAASVAHKLGYCDQDITVHMPGGEIKIQLSPDFDVVMTGPVTRIGQGMVQPEAFEHKWK